MKEWKCPRCKNNTTDLPAVSRRDNKTSICSSCGQREAILDHAIAKKPQKERLFYLIKDAMWLPPNEYNKFLQSLPVSD